MTAKLELQSGILAQDEREPLEGGERVRIEALTITRHPNRQDPSLWIGRARQLVRIWAAVLVLEAVPVLGRRRTRVARVGHPISVAVEDQLWARGVAARRKHDAGQQGAKLGESQHAEPSLPRALGCYHAVMPRSALVLVPFATLMIGCAWLFGPDDPSGPPCEDDVNGCSDDSSTFVEDPTCELTGQLDIEIGEGEDEFMTLAPGQLPEIYNGFQGGQHVWLGVRVKNPALDRPALKIRITLSFCNEGCEDPTSWQTDQVRELIAGSRTLTTTDEGWFEQASILVTLFDWSFAENRRVEMLVTDPCSRQGLAVIEG